MTKLNDAARADRNRRLGVMFGLAYGDALGRPTEFISGKTLEKFGTPFRHEVGLNRPKQGIVTDDTQMSIAVARAAAALPKHPDPLHATSAFRAELIRWFDDPKSRDGQRAPGMTCMSAVRRLKSGRNWLLATDTGSKGNGANMRVAPLALRTDWTWERLAALAQLQAAMTHGHATALAAADLTAAAVRFLLEGVAKPNERLLDHLIAYCYDQRSKYHGDFLAGLWEAGSTAPAWTPYLWSDEPQFPGPAAAGPSTRLWEDDPSWPVGAIRRTPSARTAPVVVPPRRPWRPLPTSPEEFIERGWDKMIDTLVKISDKPRVKSLDPCRVAGGGWVAEEALAGALHTLLTFPDDPTNALRRAAFTSGDSDSIASITGALAGAAYGRRAFPAHWVGNLEYRNELDLLARKLSGTR